VMLKGGGEGVGLDEGGAAVGARKGLSDGTSDGATLSVGEALGVALGAMLGTGQVENGSAQAHVMTFWMQALGSEIPLVPQYRVHPRLQSTPSQGSTHATSVHDLAPLSHWAPNWVRL
jgi:hypothetical protein